MDMLAREINWPGRVALVTGGGTGMGAAIACRLAAEGLHVVICGRREEPIQKVMALIEARGGTSRAVVADVSQEDDVARVVGAAVDTWGRVDLLVNNAGIGGGGRIHEHDIAQWDQVLAVNLRGPFLMARAVLPMMRAARWGHIVNISSESAHNYYPANGAYGVAKHALNALGEYIQVENQDHNIRVDTLSPGMVVTGMTEHNPALDHDKSLQGEDIADAVWWLVSRRPNIKIGTPVLIQTMLNPWE